MKSVYDAVVIGSGFGGAVTACRLAQAGRSVCVLERGRQWRKTDFPRTLAQMTHAFWNQTDHGLLDYRVFRNIDVIQASGVGGGSLVYFNVHRRARKEIFDRPEWPHSIRREILDPYYDQAREMLEARPLAPPAGLPMPARATLMMEAARAAGRPAELMEICVYTGPDRSNPHSGIPQQGCVYCGNCMLGCHVHAKNTLDLNYLPVAEKNGAEIFPLHEARGIEPVGEDYRVLFRRYDSTPSGNSEMGAVVGHKVVVAAGTLGSTELLLRCKYVDATLPGIKDSLGRRFSGNGDFLIPVTVDLPREIDTTWAPSITAGADFSTEEHQIFIQDLGIPDPFSWYLQGAVPAPSRLRDLWRVAKAYACRMMWFGQYESLSVGFQRLFEGELVRSMLYLGMGTDDADGSMRLVGGKLEVNWNRRSSRKMFTAMEDALRQLSDKLGGRYRPSPLWAWPWRKLLTAHPLGGCVMSERPDDGVVNEFGEIWNYRNLYVSDGSVVPGPLAINPSATITALAERTAEHLVG